MKEHLRANWKLYFMPIAAAVVFGLLIRFVFLWDAVTAVFVGVIALGGVAWAELDMLAREKRRQ